MSARIDYTKLSNGAIQGLYTIEKYLKECSVPQSILHLVKIRASQLNGCLFCLDMHMKEAKIDHEKELRLYHLSLWQESPLFDTKEKAALAWTELLTSSDNKEGVSEESFKAIRAYFSEQEVSDLTVAIAAINAWNVLGVAFQAEPGSLDKMMGLDKSGLS